MTQNYITKSKLFLQYGTDKAFPELFGDYLQYGSNRVIEGRIDLTGASYPANAMSSTSTTPTIVSNTVLFPAPPTGEMFIEKIELVAEVGLVGGTSFNIGLIQNDRATIPAGYGTSLISGEVTATLATAGMAQTYVQNTTHAGSLIGSFPAAATGPYYLTAYTAGTFSAGLVCVRIFWHGINVTTTASNITE